MIAIYIENSSMTRFIKLNAEHFLEPNPTLLGRVRRGIFKGKTLGRRNYWLSATFFLQ